ncbi:MAG TPA: FtsX-like permease family protein [Gemmatimonadaceae bacterium]|nr:FtsX-like permease family protein [Gemmatimonadaceae bacterium]
MLPTLMELRVALRTLRRSKAFAAFSILALALAIAANTTMSSLVDALLHPTYGFPHPEQLVVAQFTAPKIGMFTTFDVVSALGDSGRSYAGVSSWGRTLPVTMPKTVVVGSQGLSVPSIEVRWNYFNVVGAHQAYGRLFADSSAGHQQLAVISDRLWRQLGGDRRSFAPFTITADGDSYTVTGVLAHHAGLPADADLFLATPATANTRVLLRLRPGVTHAQALRELNVLARDIDPSHSALANFRLSAMVKGPARTLQLPTALGAATLAVLLIACANIGNLFLARGMARNRELATRVAFGASRLQVARLLFAESGLVAAAGGGLGVLVSLWTIHLLSATLPANLQYLGLVEPQLSWRVLATGIGLTVAAAVFFGVLPVVALLRADVGELLNGNGSRTTTVGGARFRLLVVAEVAAALTLAVSASMLTAAAGRIRFLDLGYDTHNLLTATVPEFALTSGTLGGVPGAGGDTASAPRFDRALAAGRYGDLERLRHDPGVVAASVMWMGNLDPDVRVDEMGGTQPRVPTGFTTTAYFVDPAFLRTLGIAVVHGRGFESTEDGPLPSVILDEGTARLFWPHGSGVGRLIHFGPTTNHEPWMRVVGITKPLLFQANCGDGPCTRHIILIANGRAFQAPRFIATYVIRARGDAGALIPRLTSFLADTHPGRMSMVRTWGEVTGISALEESHDFIASLFGAFAITGLLLALIGVYGVAAYGVERRVREFGVRIALGARTSDILRLVLRDGNATALLGLAVGLLLANWAEQFIAHFLFGFDASEPYFLAVAVVVLFAATVAAGVPPALRAARVNPVDTLRSE